MPVGEVPPARVAVAKIVPPWGTDGEAWVLNVGVSRKAVFVKKKVLVPVAPVPVWVPLTIPISVVWMPGPGLLSRVGIFSTEKV